MVAYLIANGFPPAAHAASAPQTSGTVATSGTSVTSETITEVVVTGSAPQEGSAEAGYRVETATLGLLGTVTLQDTPYSINVASADLIKNLQAQSVTSALKTDPTVAFDLPENRGSSYVNIRGFLVNQYALDGMRILVDGPVEDKERIEVLDGPNSFLFGMTNPGGMINYVLKRPTTTDFLDITVGDYGGEQLYTHIDAGGPLDKTGKVAYRFNALYVPDFATATDHQTHERYLLSGAIDWHLGPDTLLSFDASTYWRDLKGYQAFFRLGKITKLPAPPDPSKNYGEPYASSEDSETRAGVEFKTKLDETFSLRSAFRFTRDTDEQINIQNTFLNSEGDYNQTRSWAGWNPYEAYTYQGYTYLDANFDTGFLEHKVSVGVADDQTYYLSDFSATSVSMNIPSTFISSLSNPIYYFPYPGTKGEWNTDGPSRTIQKTNYLNTLLVDTVKITEQWSVMLGANCAAVFDDQYDPASGEQTSKNHTWAVTPNVAIMFKPIPKITTYVAYTEGLTEGETAPSDAANANRVLDPYIARQVEVGAKSTLWNMNLNLALFHIEKNFAYTDPSDNVFKANGRELHNGCSLTASGKLTQDLTLVGGFTFQDATIHSIDETDGKTPDAVPQQIARIYSEYNLPFYRRLTLTGGISYVGSQWVDGANTNTLSIPYVVMGDVGARYQCKIYGNDVTFRFNVTNVTDKAYWTTWQGGRVYVGDPRTYICSAEIRF